MNLRNPRMIGFGISNRQTFETASANAAGCIIGSKFVKQPDDENGNTGRAIKRLFFGFINVNHCTGFILSTINNTSIIKYHYDSSTGFIISIHKT